MGTQTLHAAIGFGQQNSHLTKVRKLLSCSNAASFNLDCRYYMVY